MPKGGGLTASAEVVWPYATRHLRARLPSFNATEALAVGRDPVNFGSVGSRTLGKRTEGPPSNGVRPRFPFSPFFDRVVVEKRRKWIFAVF